MELEYFNILSHNITYKYSCYVLLKILLETECHYVTQVTPNSFSPCFPHTWLLSSLPFAKAETRALSVPSML